MHNTYNHNYTKFLLVFFSEYIEDPDTEVALNLIRVDHSTGKAIVEIPIRPRPVKDLIKEVRKLKNGISQQQETNKIKSEEEVFRTKLDSINSTEDIHLRTGKNLYLCMLCL